MPTVIRVGTEDDLPEMVRLWREMMDVQAGLDPRVSLNPAPEAEEAWAQHVRDDVWGSDKWCVLVAESNGKLVGQIIGLLRDRHRPFPRQTYGYVTDIVVAADVRRQGIGRALFAALMEWVRERGADHVQLQVLASNSASQAFWRAMGCRDYSHILWRDLEA